VSIYKKTALVWSIPSFFLFFLCLIRTDDQSTEGSATYEMISAGRRSTLDAVEKSAYFQPRPAVRAWAAPETDDGMVRSPKPQLRAANSVRNYHNIQQALSQDNEPTSPPLSRVPSQQSSHHYDAFKGLPNDDTYEVPVNSRSSSTYDMFIDPIVPVSHGGFHYGAHEIPAQYDVVDDRLVHRNSWSRAPSVAIHSRKSEVRNAQAGPDPSSSAIRSPSPPRFVVQEAPGQYDSVIDEKAVRFNSWSSGPSASDHSASLSFVRGQAHSFAI
jgi:hypothetical protein